MTHWIERRCDTMAVDLAGRLPSIECHGVPHWRQCVRTLPCVHGSAGGLCYWESHRLSQHPRTRLGSPSSSAPYCQIVISYLQIKGK